ncbi:ABC transporter substrate-binding protein [Winogradskyella undariae]|uniref:type IX secretion system anionic LPS delivery protein PorZ n=1 Tax=Winogradskyella undariae TaxID=1285465 RepID=UPI00156B7D37|nr:ABC transporter substrate-binding protein [Winogradskyella undariae]NRR93295.1 ABC transporter substrate-binding protein [Winogradskyella undariae]
MSNTYLKILILVFGLTASSYSQDYSSLWQSHYSYNAIVDVVSGENKIFAAAQNAVFEYNTLTHEITTISSVEGLSGEQITTIYYSEFYQYLLIGYETGLIELYSETDNSVFTVVDILDKQNITPANKGINHFFENEGLIYISTDYGISIYDLERLEFGDTYFIGSGGSQVTVKQVSILNNEIYAACIDGNGLKKADLTSPNLIDYNQWQTIFLGSFYTMNTINNKMYSVRSNNMIYEINGASVVGLFSLPLLPVDADVSGANLIYSTSGGVRLYDENLQLVQNFEPSEDFDTDFTSATVLEDEVFIGTAAFGVLTNSISTPSISTQIKPSGPIDNNIFKLNATTHTVWATYGEYSDVLNPYPLTSMGVSYLYNDVWDDIPVDSLFNAVELNEITPSIFNPNQVFISSFFNGLVEINDFEATNLYNEANSGLESLLVSGDPDYVDVRVSATDFDSSGLLWIISSRIESPLKSYDSSSGTWRSYDFSNLIDPPSEEEGFFDMEIDNNGTKWIGSYDNGLIAYNENITTNPLRNINSESQNVDPYSRFLSLAIDNSNQLWTGSTNGLRVLYNTSGFYDNTNPSLSSIIILEDGIAKELLEGESIIDIKVDASNNKWIGTLDSGVFYLSPDGQTTIYHFTNDNSPLPSNQIRDISINEDDGIVYIATAKGLLSFKAGGSAVQSSLEDAFVYPNPVRPEYNILGFSDLNDVTKGVKIKGLTERVNIKITDIEGNLVAEAQSSVNLRSSNANYNFAIDGGTAIWNGKNLANNVVRTGVYVILISDLDTFETKVLKVLIVK